MVRADANWSKRDVAISSKEGLAESLQSVDAMQSC